MVGLIAILGVLSVIAPVVVQEDLAKRMNDVLSKGEDENH